MRRKRRRDGMFKVLGLIGMVLFAVQVAGLAQAEYPERPIIMLKKAGPGSTVDLTDQLLAKLAPKYLGVEMPVIYKKGCSGCNAQTYIQERPADGYHIFFDTTTTAIVLALGKVRYTEDDWKFIIRMHIDPQGIAIRADAPWKNLKEMMDWARDHPRELRVAGANPVGLEPFTVMRLEEATGVDVTYVPVSGGSEVVALLLGKHIDAGVASACEVGEYVKAGKLRMAGIGHRERLADYPSWSTWREQGIDVEVHMFRGLFVKEGTPEKIINKLHTTFKAMNEDPDMVKFLKKAGVFDGYMGGPEESDAWFKEQVKLFRNYFKK